MFARPHGLNKVGKFWNLKILIVFYRSCFSVRLNPQWTSMKLTKMELQYKELTSYTFNGKTKKRNAKNCKGGGLSQGQIQDWGENQGQDQKKNQCKHKCPLQFLAVFSRTGCFSPLQLLFWSTFTVALLNQSVIDQKLRQKTQNRVYEFTFVY